MTTWQATVLAAPKRTDSTERLLVAVTGPTEIVGEPVTISVDGGTTWTACVSDTTGVHVLAGPGHLVLPGGIVRVLVRVTGAVEIPVLDAGRIYVEQGVTV